MRDAFNHFFFILGFASLHSHSQSSNNHLFISSIRFLCLVCVCCECECAFLKKRKQKEINKTKQKKKKNPLFVLFLILFARTKFGFLPFWWFSRNKLNRLRSSVPSQMWLSMRNGGKLATQNCENPKTINTFRSLTWSRRYSRQRKPCVCLCVSIICASAR